METKSYKNWKSIFVLFTMFFAVMTPAFAGAPADVINPPPGDLLYTLQPYLEMNPDPLAVGYKCQIAEDPSYVDIAHEFTQVIPPQVTNVIGESTFSNITAGTPYMMRCEADHGAGYTGAYGSDWDFILAEAMQHKCQPTTEGVNTGEPIVYFSVYTDQYGDTPINETIFLEQTSLDYTVHVNPAYGSNPALEFNVSYNDTVFYVTDTYDLTYQPHPVLNEHDYISEIDTEKHRFCWGHGANMECEGNTKYNATLTFDVTGLTDSCDYTYQYAVNLQPNVDQTDGSTEGAVLISLTALLIMIALLLRRNGNTD